MKFIVGSVVFPSKKAATEFMRELVAEHKGCGVFQSQLLVDLLLQHHYDPEYVFGCGVAGFIVAQREQWGDNFGFDILRTDGSQEPFTWTKCINGWSHKSMVRQAARFLVKSQVIEYRDAYLLSQDTCEATGAQLQGTVHVDHVAEFEPMFSSWKTSQGLCDDDIEVMQDESGLAGFTRFTDQTLVSKWQEYHQMFAIMRVTTPEYNLKRTA